MGKKEALYRNLKSTLSEKVAVIHATVMDGFGIDLTTVAFVEVDPALSDIGKCEKAFMLTNSINDAWWNNEEVTKMFDGGACRSTSTGDMILVGTKKYLCETCGWKEVDNA